MLHCSASLPDLLPFPKLVRRALDEQTDYASIRPRLAKVLEDVPESEVTMDLIRELVRKLMREG
jgi:hypothetical protein